MRFLELLLKKNEVVNLTAVRDLENAFWKHLADSLSVLCWEPLGALCDWGSGGGLPGIPLALVRKHRGDDSPVVFLDSVAKKIRAIEEFSGALGLRRVRHCVGRGEELIKTGQLADIQTVVMRAVAPPERAVHWLSPRIPHWIFFLGPSQRELWEKALPRLSSKGLAINAEKRFSLPRGQGERFLLRLSKCST
jgi:16S rRNA (guanine527-N7)-methyltransferase